MWTHLSHLFFLFWIISHFFSHFFVCVCVFFFDSVVILIWTNDVLPGQRWNGRTSALTESNWESVKLYNSFNCYRLNNLLFHLRFITLLCVQICRGSRSRWFLNRWKHQKTKKRSNTLITFHSANVSTIYFRKKYKRIYNQIIG